jgi:predicted dehydrogenase
MSFRKALLLAAGRGTRLGPAAGLLPKPLLRVRGKVILERHLEQLAAGGVQEVWINLHHRGEAIREHCGDGTLWGLRIHYSEEPELLGTSGALRRLQREFEDGPFFVAYGDNLGFCDYAALAAAHRPGTLLTLALCHREEVASSGIAELTADGRVVRFAEKPDPANQFSHWVNAGIYAASPELLQWIPDGFSDFGRDIIPRLVEGAAAVRGFVLAHTVQGVDTPEMLAQADVLGIALIGAGRMGARRAATVHADAGCRLLRVVDAAEEKARALTREFGGRASAVREDAVCDPEVDAVIVSTPNHLLAEAGRAALAAGKHVLVEKPAARHSRELEPLVELAAARRLVLKAGFNYRFHPAIQRARKVLDSGEIGGLRHLVARHGHGGRPGLEREWRADPQQSGGGELLDQGVHLIDLFRWFAQEELAKVQALVRTEFWPIEPLEDTAFCLFSTPSGVTCSLLVSLLEWKNRFEFEATGERGSVRVEGLGGSYGPERLFIIRRAETFGPPQVETFEFENPERCWSDEWAEFVAAVRQGSVPSGDGHDSLAALRAVEACYRSAREQKSVSC